MSKNQLIRHYKKGQRALCKLFNFISFWMMKLLIIDIWYLRRTNIPTKQINKNDFVDITGFNIELDLFNVIVILKQFDDIWLWLSHPISFQIMILSRLKWKRINLKYNEVVFYDFIRFVSFACFMFKGVCESFAILDWK